MNKPKAVFREKWVPVVMLYYTVGHEKCPEFICEYLAGLILTLSS